MVTSMALEEGRSKRDGMTSGKRRIEDQVRFWPFVYFGLNGEDIVSNSERVAFEGTRPLSMMGHLKWDLGWPGWADENVIQDTTKKILRLTILDIPRERKCKIML